ncbi:hypothetical protein [Massilia sp. DD77]|uniref:hypothetical protein n=1 Tax=Massilia sp. DD77 TaxID=3109349 RepID=UPI003000422D
MIEGRIGFVIVDGPVLFVMVVDALVMLELVNQRGRTGNRRKAALHGETIQRQAQQQEEMDNPAQEYHQASFAKL